MSDLNDPDDDRCPDCGGSYDSDGFCPCGDARRNRGYADCGNEEPYIYTWDRHDSDADGPCLEEGEADPDDEDCDGAEDAPPTPLAPEFTYVVTEVTERPPGWMPPLPRGTRVDVPTLAEAIVIWPPSDDHNLVRVHGRLVDPASAPGKPVGSWVEQSWPRHQVRPVVDLSDMQVSVPTTVEVDVTVTVADPERTTIENMFVDGAADFLTTHFFPEGQDVGDAGTKAHEALVDLLVEAYLDGRSDVASRPPSVPATGPTLPFSGPLVEEAWVYSAAVPDISWPNIVRKEDGARLIDLPDVQVTFGLSDEQVEAVRGALVAGDAWEKIAREVSWEPATLREHYQRAIHRFRGPLSDMQREALAYVAEHDGAPEDEIGAALMSHDYTDDYADALYGLVLLGELRWDGPRDGTTPLRYWIRQAPKKRCDGCRAWKSVERGHRLCPVCEAAILERRRADGLPELLDRVALGIEGAKGAETAADAAMLVLGKAAPETDDEVLALFSTLVCVPTGWSLVADREQGGPYFAFDHQESGLTLEVFPPGVPRMENACSWQMRDTATQRIVGWNVAFAGRDEVLASRALCFERVVPKRLQ